MSAQGLVVNWGGQHPNRPELLKLNPSWVRSILYNSSDLLALLPSIPESIKLIVLINNEHKDVGGDWEGLEWTLKDICLKAKGRIAAIEIGNELDLWGWGPQDAAALSKRAAPILRQHGVKSLLSSVASSDWVNWLKAAAKHAAGSLDGVSLHPYGASAEGYPTASYLTGKLEEKIQTAYSVSGLLPVYVTEMGVKIGEVGGEKAQALWVRKAFSAVEKIGPTICPAACLFAYHDANGAPEERGDSAFGLIEADTERKRDAYYTFASLSAGRPVIVPPPAPPSFNIGAGVQALIAKKKLTPVGNETYLNSDSSTTPCAEGIVYWIKSDGKARFIPWQE